MLQKTTIKEIEKEDEKKYLSLSDTLNNNSIKLDTIVFVEAINEDCIIHINNGNKQVIKKTLDSLNILLPQQKFIQIPPSHIVNIAFINRYVTGIENYLVLHNAVRIPISENQKKMFSLII